MNVFSIDYVGMFLSVYFALPFIEESSHRMEQEDAFKETFKHVQLQNKGKSNTLFILNKMAIVYNDRLILETILFKEKKTNLPFQPVTFTARDIT